MRVLIVEDFAPIADSVCQGLTEAGFAVDVARDGAEGQWHVKSCDYDVVVLDLMLPKVDGKSILKDLRARASDAAVLILSAKDTLEDRIDGLNHGADDYLVKPFEFGELLARVRAMARRKYRVTNPVIRIADLEVDTVQRRVRRDGLDIELTPREYALLEYLVARQGELVTRTDIWEHVYDFHDASASNVVDVYIGYLRKKLERPGRQRLIVTRRGHGYVLGETNP